MFTTVRLFGVIEVFRKYITEENGLQNLHFISVICTTNNQKLNDQKVEDCCYLQLHQTDTAQGKWKSTWKIKCACPISSVASSIKHQRNLEIQNKLIRH